MLFDNDNRRSSEIEAQLPHYISTFLSTLLLSLLLFSLAFITRTLALPSRASRAIRKSTFGTSDESVCPLSVCSADEYLSVNGTRGGTGVPYSGGPHRRTIEKTLFNFGEHAPSASELLLFHTVDDPSRMREQS